MLSTVDDIEDDEWIVIDHGANGPTEGHFSLADVKPSFLEVLMKRSMGRENQGYTCNVQNLSYVGHRSNGAIGDKLWNRNEHHTDVAQQRRNDEIDFATEYYEGKKDRDSNRTQGINRLSMSSQAAKDRRLTSKSNA